VLHATIVEALHIAVVHRPSASWAVLVGSAKVEGAPRVGASGLHHAPREHVPFRTKLDSRARERSRVRCRVREVPVAHSTPAPLPRATLRTVVALLLCGHGRGDAHSRA
jgi:hypothetical protein